MGPVQRHRGQRRLVRPPHERHAGRRMGSVDSPAAAADKIMDLTARAVLRHPGRSMGSGRGARKWRRPQPRQRLACASPAVCPKPAGRPPPC